MVSSIAYIGELLLLPLVGAICLTYLTLRALEGSWATHGVPREVESDLRNENLAFEVHHLNHLLFFGFYFNLLFLTINVSFAGRVLYANPYIYAVSLGAYLVALALAIIFVLRFYERRFALLAALYAGIGALALYVYLVLGLEPWSSSGGSVNLIVPLTLAGTAWAIALVSFLLDYGLLDEPLPFRFERTGAYRTLMTSLAVGYFGTLLAFIHVLMTSL